MEAGVIGTILGGLLGFLASVLPDLITGLSKKTTETTTTGTNGSVVDTDPTPQPTTDATTATPAAKKKHETYNDGDTTHFISLDYLRASVRPVLTYAFFAMFAYIKLIVMWQALTVEHVKASELLPILWDQGTEALFAAVLAFWFGSRAMVRFRKKK